MQKNISRREFLRFGGLGLLGSAGAALLSRRSGHAHGQAAPTPTPEVGHEVTHNGGQHVSHGGSGVVGAVDHEFNRFHPSELLVDFDYGAISALPGGQRLREYEFIAVDREIEIAPSLRFPAWAFGSLTSPEAQRRGGFVGRVPGPTIRCVEGDRVRIKMVNAGSHPHTMHFHGIHSAAMDGVPGVGPGVIEPGQSVVYEFDARPFGCHLYHCHALPLARHIHKGLYGGFIIDPDPDKYTGEERRAAAGRNHQHPENREWQELFMLMNAFDTNFDKENEVYAVNTIAFGYMDDPIPVKRDRPVRIYLVNLTEFDPINSMHIHANFFDYYDHGTTLTPTLKTVDTIMQCQAQRGIIEVSFKGFEPGRYMFHAHQSEFAELGWMGFFDVQE